MKIENSRSAARHFDLADPSGNRETIPVEPSNPGTIHAYLYDPDPVFASPTLKWILKQAGTALLEFGHDEAACGMAVRVIYRMRFDTADPDACSRCRKMFALWVADRDEYHRRVRERHEEWRQREARGGGQHYTSQSPTYPG